MPEKSPWQQPAGVILRVSRLAVCHSVHLAIVTALIGLSFGSDISSSVFKVLPDFATSVGFNFVILCDSGSGRRLSMSPDLKSPYHCVGDKKRRAWRAARLHSVCWCAAYVHSFCKYGTIFLTQEVYRNALLGPNMQYLKYFDLVVVSHAGTWSFQEDFSCRACWPSCSWRPGGWRFWSPGSPVPVADCPPMGGRWSRLCVNMRSNQPRQYCKLRGRELIMRSYG